TAPERPRSQNVWAALPGLQIGIVLHQASDAGVGRRLESLILGVLPCPGARQRAPGSAQTDWKCRYAQRMRFCASDELGLQGLVAGSLLAAASKRWRWETQPAPGDP